MLHRSICSFLKRSRWKEEQLNVHIHTYRGDRVRGGGGKGKPELRDRPFWKIGKNGKMTQSVSAKIVHFAFWPISVLGTVYDNSF
jgi:hypothetical protein